MNLDSIRKRQEAVAEAERSMCALEARVREAQEATWKAAEALWLERVKPTAQSETTLPYYGRPARCGCLNCRCRG